MAIAVLRSGETASKYHQSHDVVFTKEIWGPSSPVDEMEFKAVKPCTGWPGIMLVVVPCWLPLSRLGMVDAKATRGGAARSDARAKDLILKG